MYKLRKIFRSKTVKSQEIKNNSFSSSLQINPIRSPNFKPSKIISLKKFTINQRSFLEILLGFIKTSQIDLISSSKNDLKKILTTLTENLKSISNEQSKKEKYYLDEINKKKKILQEKIFENGKNEELTKFKNLNFEIENNINTVDYMIDNKKKILDRIKLLDFMPEENKEILLEQNTNLHKNIINLMHVSLIKKTEKLCNLLTEKRGIDKDIKNLENIINYNKNLNKNENTNFRKIPEINKKYFVENAIEEEKETIYENEYTTIIHENLTKNYEYLEEKCVNFSDTEESENIKRNLSLSNSDKMNQTFDNFNTNLYLDIYEKKKHQNEKISSRTNNSFYKSVSTDI